MKIDNRKLGDCRVKLIIDATPEETKPDYDKVVRQYVQRARIPGFRQGKAPLGVIQKFLGAELLASAKEALVSRLSSEAMKQENVEVANIVSVDDVVFSPESGINFTVTIDVKPEVKLPKYQKMPIKAEEVKVDEAQVQGQLEALRKSVSPRNETTDPVAKGDIVGIDFRGEIGGVPLAEAKPDAEKILAEGTSRWVEADEDSDRPFIPGIASALMGKKTGDEFSFEAKFPSDFHDAALRGEKVSYTGTIRAVRRYAPVSDEELAKVFEVESCDALRDRIRERFRSQAQMFEDMRLDSEIRDWLDKKCSFPVPDSIVAIRTSDLYEGVIREEIDKAKPEDASVYAREHAADIHKIAEERARRQVRLSYVFEAIAKEQGIEVTDSDVNKVVAEISSYHVQQGDKSMTPQRVGELLRANGRIGLLRQGELEKKVLDYLRGEVRNADYK